MSRSKAKSRMKSQLTDSTKTDALLARIAVLFAAKPTALVIKKGLGFRANASTLDAVALDPTLDFNNLEFQRILEDGKEQTEVVVLAETGAKEATDVTCVADTGAKATATLNITADITLTSVLMGTGRNTNTFTLQVLAAAANPTDTVLAGFSGTSAAIVCTITPNDGTNNAATPVDLTTAELVELINTGAVAGKTVTVTDASGFRNDQTATGGDATNLADAGEGDGVVATFADGVASNLNSKYFTYVTRNSGGASTNSRYVWFNVNSEGVDPAPGGTGIAVALSAGASANTVASGVRTELAADNKVAITGATSHAIITNLYMGTATDAANGAASPGFSYSITQGVASNNLDNYFTLFTAEDGTKYYVWFNVNSEGTDPAVASATAVPIAVAIGASASTIATAVAAALDALAGFVSAAVSATVTITNAAAGYSTDVADAAGGAATGFTITKLGELEQYDTADIILIKRLRTKKYMIVLNESSSAQHAE